MVEVNYLAVLAATVVNMVLGFLWYGPVFGKQWMREMGFTAEHMRAAQQKGMAKSYIIMAVGAVLVNYVLAYWLMTGELAFGPLDVTMAMVAAFWAWLGFIAPVLTGAVLWEGKSWTLYILNAAYYLVVLEVAAVIIALWR